MCFIRFDQPVDARFNARVDGRVLRLSGIRKDKKQMELQLFGQSSVEDVLLQPPSLAHEPFYFVTIGSISPFLLRDRKTCLHR